MTFDQLLKAVNIELDNNKPKPKSILTISNKGLGNNVKAILNKYFNSKPIDITDLSNLEVSAEQQCVTFTGKCALFNANPHIANGKLTVDKQGQVHLYLSQSLQVSTSKKNKWKFSDDLPDLPKVLYGYNFSNDPFIDKAENDPIIPIDQLDLANAEWILVTESVTDSRSGATLLPGINIVSELVTHNALNLVSHWEGKTNDQWVIGQLVYPEKVLTTKRYKTTHPKDTLNVVYPWDIDKNTGVKAPGLNLEIPLDQTVWLVPKKLSLTLKDSIYYSPLNKEWLLKDTNPVLKPCQAFRGRITWHESDMEIDITAPLYPNQQQLAIYGDCKNVTLKNLEALVGEFGDIGSLTDKLPSPIQKAIKTLNKLALLDFNIVLNSPGSKALFESAQFVVGIPDLNWTIWPKHIVANSLSISVEFAEDDKVSLAIDGIATFEGVEFRLCAHSDDEFEVLICMNSGFTLPLNKVMSKFAPKLNPPGDLTVSSFRAGFVPGKAYSFALGLAATPDTWVLHLGPVPLIISDILLGIQKNQSTKTTQGNFSGKLEVANQLVDISYDVPGPFQILWRTPSVQLSDLLESFSQHAITLPPAFDLHLVQCSALVREEKDNLRLEWASSVEGLGEFAFVLTKHSGKWQSAIGLTFIEQSPAQMHGFNVVQSFMALFHLEEFMLVASTYAATDFHFGDAAKVSLPSSKPGSKASLSEGLSLLAKWHLQTNDKSQNLLRKFLGLDPTLEVIIQLGAEPEKDSRLFVDYQSTVAGHPFDCQLGAQWQNGELGLFLSGYLTVPIQGHDQTFSAYMEFVENGAFLSASMTGDGGIKFGDFTLQDLSLEVGVSFEGIPSLGIAATLAEDSICTSFALFFDSAEPAKSLLAGSISPLSLEDVLTTLVPKSKDIRAAKARQALEALKPVFKQIQLKGTHEFKVPSKVATDLQQNSYESIASAFKEVGGIEIPSDSSQLHLITLEKGQSWALTDLTTLRHYQLTKHRNTIVVTLDPQFYCAPQATMIGTQRFPEGLFLNGEINFFGFSVSASVSIDTRKGIAIDEIMDPVCIGGSHLLSITGAGKDKGPRVSIATYTQPKEQNPAFRNPHFYISGSLSLLGIKDSVLISITNKGFEFDIKGNLVKSVSFDLGAHIAGPQHLSIHGSAKVGLGTIDLGVLGKIHIDTDAKVTLRIGINGAITTAEADINFEALGKSHHIASLKLNIKDPFLAKLEHIVGNEVKKLVSNTAKAMLKDLDKAQRKVNGLSKNINHMRKQVKKEQQQNSHAFKVAKNQVAKTQKSLNSINKQISADNKKIKHIKSAISKKRKWSHHGNIFSKVERGVAYAAYAAEKGAEITALSTAVAGMVVSKGAAQGALEVAKQSLKGLESAAKVMPIDLDPRVAGLISAKAVATAELNVIKAPLKALS